MKRRGHQACFHVKAFVSSIIPTHVDVHSKIETLLDQQLLTSCFGYCWMLRVPAQASGLWTGVLFCLLLKHHLQLQLSLKATSWAYSRIFTNILGRFAIFCESFIHSWWLSRSIKCPLKFGKHWIPKLCYFCIYFIVLNTLVYIFILYILLLLCFIFILVQKFLSSHLSLIMKHRTLLPSDFTSNWIPETIFLKWTELTKVVLAGKASFICEFHLQQYKLISCEKSHVPPYLFWSFGFWISRLYRACYSHMMHDGDLLPMQEN